MSSDYPEITKIVPVDRGPEPDAHGQAAMLLAESTLHVLVERGLLSNTDVVGIVRVACEVKVEVAQTTGESQGRMEESLALLRAIGATFEAVAA